MYGPVNWNETIIYEVEYLDTLHVIVISI